VVNNLTNTIAFNTQRLLFDEHSTQLTPPCSVVELVALYTILGCAVDCLGAKGAAFFSVS
jgi:hypothetical protein